MTHKMRWWLVVLGAVGLLTALAQSHFITQPGYMDACYAYNGGYSVAGGRGWNDPFLWNYLDDPVGLPHPSHAYWMPLPSLVAAAGMRMFGLDFRGAQVPFVLLAALLPAVTGWAAWRLLANARQAALAGMLAAFTGFYAAYSTTTDGFILYTLIGTGVFMIAAEALARPRNWLWLALGVLLGLGHLTRADGLLFSAVVLSFVWVRWPRPTTSGARPRAQAGSSSRTLGLALIVFGYLAVTGAWYLRNQLALGAWLPGGGLRTLWLTEYDEFFHYPAADLDFQHLLSSGWGAIALARGAALVQNVQTLLVVQGWVVLAPFAIAGLWHLRARREVQLAVGYLLALFIVMTIAFPWPGARGGYFHSSAAFIPLLAAAAAHGLDRSVEWLAERRGWVAAQAQVVFGTAAAVLACGLTLFLFASRALGLAGVGTTWARQDEAYRQAGEVIRADGGAAPVVAVNNPPCFYYQAQLPAVVIPQGGAQALQDVVERYEVTYIVVDRNLPSDLVSLFADGGVPAWLTPIGRTSEETGNALEIFRVTRP
ncbi:MAG: hypothetical protein A2Z30_00600 [Chloroflexi bacterium RBG_16_64_43]|nr:MAG: hypothetical protein A2Z30_00600 [Chloroflexi bacterium RBG_16_64_43]